MRRKIVSLLLALVVVALVLSCKVEVLKGDESINNMLYPYLEFTLSEDGTYYTAEVIENVRLEKVEIPEAIDNLGSSIPVKWFKGFKNKEDGKNLKTIVLNSGETNIVTDAISNSLSLISIEMNVGKKYTRWPNLPILDNTSEKEFKGWYIYGTETEIVSGEIVNRRNPKIIPAWGEHTLTHVEAKDATCTESGWNQYDVCSTCSYNTKIIIPARGHNIVLREEVSPTCTEKGTRKHYECTNCHLLFSDSKGDNIINEIELSPLRHLVSLVEEKEAKCETEGIKEHYECERCHSLFSDSNAESEVTLESLKINPLGHDWKRNEYSKDNKCTWDECTRCHETINPSGHNWDTGIVTKEPTAKEKGIKTYTCTVCKHTKTEDISPLDSIDHTHIWVEKEKISPTCVKTGYTVKKCSLCKITYNTDYKDAFSHKMTEIEEKQATCTINGHRKHYKCSVCNNLYLDKNGINETSQSEVEEGYLAKGHDWEKDYKHDEARHWYKCKNCDARKDEENHTLSNIVDGKFVKSEATCTEAKVYYKSCVCGYSPETETFISDSDSPLGHDLEKVEEVKSTCMDQGLKAYWKCKRDCCFGEDNYYDENGNKIDKATLILPLADHEIIRYDADGEYHYPVCKLHGKLKEKGEKHNKDESTYDKHSHWKCCSICGFQWEKHAHKFILVGSITKCSECGYEAQDDSKSDSGFDVGVDYQTPDGSIEYIKVGETVTVTFKDKSIKEEYKTTKISWYLDNVLQEEDGEVFTFSAPYKRYYSVRCSFVNQYGRGNSAPLSILGGSN